MKKLRKQVYQMETYLKNLSKNNIRKDATVQRLAGQWNNEMTNELIMTVLQEGYIAEIMLGEEDNTQLWIIDGLQRSASFEKFRFGNHKIGKTLSPTLIKYNEKEFDKDGNAIFIEKEFDVKNKGYEQLPVELQQRFDEYQIATVIFEHCTMEDISDAIVKYNNHVPMNVAQKGFARAKRFAENIREITEMDFFVKKDIYKENDIIKGNRERIVCETVMCINYIDNWKRQLANICTFLNENATTEQFDHVRDNISRLSALDFDGKKMKKIFTVKDSFIFLTLFDRFTQLGMEDSKFVDFLIEFDDTLREEKRNKEGFLFDEIDKNLGTKDKTVILAKLEFLTDLMNEYLHINEEDLTVNTYDFVKNNVDSEVTEEDVSQYEEVLDDLTVNVDNNSRLLEAHNRPSLVGIVAYSFKNDINLDDWIVEYFKSNNSYILNTMQNYLHMKEHLNSYIQESEQPDSKIETHECKYCGSKVYSNVSNELCDKCKELFGHTYFDEL